MRIFIGLLGLLLASSSFGYSHGQPSDAGLDATFIADHQSQENRDVFYPPFSSYENQPSGHSRPLYPQQEAAYSHRPVGAYQQRFDYDTAKYAGYKDPPRDNLADVGLLGSGNFGVIRGGTFYQENADSESSNFDDEFSSYYQNGHGGPSYRQRQNPRPYQHEQFANFRDFADINTPSYSQYIIVYANKNGTATLPNAVVHRRPNNIFESLTQLDVDNPVPSVPPKKLSKSKRKLALLYKEKKHKYKKTENSDAAVEPLLALS